MSMDNIHVIQIRTLCRPDNFMLTQTDHDLYCYLRPQKYTMLRQAPNIVYILMCPLLLTKQRDPMSVIRIIDAMSAEKCRHSVHIFPVARFQSIYPNKPTTRSQQTARTKVGARGRPISVHIFLSQKMWTQYVIKIWTLCRQNKCRHSVHIFPVSRFQSIYPKQAHDKQPANSTHKSRCQRAANQRPRPKPETAATQQLDVRTWVHKFGGPLYKSLGSFFRQTDPGGGGGQRSGARVV
jgi:hypothetical protein